MLRGPVRTKGPGRANPQREEAGERLPGLRRGAGEGEGGLNQLRVEGMNSGGPMVVVIARQCELTQCR